MNLPEIKRPIFISYAHKDFRIALEVFRSLRASPHQSAEEVFQDVFLNFPPMDMVPPDMHGQLEIYINLSLANLGFQAPAHWGLEILPTMIARSESLLLILTKHSKMSEAVREEFRLYPERKPVWILQVNGEPVPEAFAARRNVHVRSIGVDVPLMFQTVMAAAEEFNGQKELAEANRLYFEAINLLFLIDGFDPLLMANVWARKGVTENRLGLGDGAVQTLTGALLLIRDEPEGAMHAHILADLGYAYRLAGEHKEAGRDKRLSYIGVARKCWQDCRRILKEQEAELKQLPRYPYERLLTYCELSLEETVQAVEGPIKQ